MTEVNGTLNGTVIYPSVWSMSTGGRSCTCCLVMLSWTPSSSTSVTAPIGMVICWRQRCRQTPRSE
jgi:hypothetical protein